jgi:hypothetical protein
MINYDADGITLVDSSGKRAGPRDADDYIHMLSVRDAQQAADRENNTAGFKYHTDLANFQGALDAGRAVGLSSPAKPKMKIVSDDGVTTEGPFVPSLPDAIYPVISPSGSIKSTPAPDRTDILINLMLTINGKLDRLLAK